MRWSLSLSVVFVLLPAFAAGQDFKMEPGPKSPEDSLKCINLRPGFKAELMVAEPLVQSPIAFAWGADGKFWVVEMGDYPLGLDGKGKPGGKIKFLEKTKPDGPYDKMTVFMDGLGFPTGVLPYGKGVLVTCAPDIFYAELGPDGKAVKEVIFTGFKEGNQQHRVNGLSWGIDNWIYGANGDSGGKVECSKKTGLLTREVRPDVVDIRGRDFRFKVETGEFEAQSGQSQFGRCRDDWGNWFGNNNSNPMFHYVLDDHYLKRNPNVLYPDVRVPVSVKPGASQVYPISKPLPRFNSPDALNHFTSACSTIVYRDTLFGKEFEGNMFVSEPVHNLIHREIMKPKGVTFTSQRADDEQTSEFLASSDNWFRPTMIQTGPDGALWVADMYRYVIEHPEWIPKDWQKKLDLRAGQDKGRIYRVYPADKKPRAIVRMDTMSVSDLAKKLESPNGPTRDLAHRLLADLKGSAEAMKDVDREALPVWRKSTMPQARLHALSILDELKRLPADEFAKALSDPHPAVRRYALRIYAGDKVRFFPPGNDELYLNDTDLQTRMEYGYTLGVWKTAKSAQLLARYLVENADDRYLLAAGLSSISKEIWTDFFFEITKLKSIPGPLFGPMMRMAGVHGKSLDVSRLFVRQLNSQQQLSSLQKIVHVGEMFEAMDRSDQSLRALLESAGAADVDGTLENLKQIHAEAVKIMENPKSPVNEKILAMRLLGRGFGNDKGDHKLLLALLTPRFPDDVQAAVIGQLARGNDVRTPGLLLEPWKHYSPKLRGQVLDLLFSRSLWTQTTLEMLARKQLPAHEIDATRRERLLFHKDNTIREAARKIFAAASNRDRGQVVDETWLLLPDKGDRERGGKLFAKACATCHQLGGVGAQVGPDLASVGDKSPQGLLTAILDPNRAVESRYINYQASTRSGLTYTGILAGETSTSITLVGPDGKKHQLLRNELEDLASTGKSLMPEGLEKDLSPQNLADIIAYVRANQQALKRKEFAGNQPETVRPDKDGVFFLLPKNGAIYGPKIVLEKQGNLGWWTSLEDQVVWTVEVPVSGVYRVWINYACANDSAGNTLALRSGDARLPHKVGGTGAWENYFALEIGELKLSEGTREITIRAEGTLRNALLDLKEVKLVPR